MIKNKDSKQLGIKSVVDVFGDEWSQEAKINLYILSKQEKSIDYKRLNFKRDKNLEFSFRDYKSLRVYLRAFITKRFQ